MLYEGTGQGNYLIHPQYKLPRLTHLAFAVDLLVFSDGLHQSISGITSILHLFRSYSGLDMNAVKSSLIFASYSRSEAMELGDHFGIKMGSFPSRFLGLPLNPTCLNLATLQPFMEQITGKLYSWTTNFLPYTGKIRLIVSVIYGKINFWSQVFVLPKAFYEKN